MNQERLGHILLKQGLIDSEKLDFCLSVQKNNGRQKLGQILCHYEFVEESAIAKSIAYQVGWELYQGGYELDFEMLTFFGAPFFIEKVVFPLKEEGKRVFVLTRIDDTELTDEISRRLNQRVIFKVGIEKDLRKAINELCETEQRSQRSQGEVAIEEDLNKWFEDCLAYAVSQGASDIHIEPSQKVVEIRLRIDGILNFYQTLPLKSLPRLVNIIFHKSDVSISDFSHFHDAKFMHKCFNRLMDVRVSHIPSIHGSSLVLRLLDKSKTVMDLSDLGYAPNSWEIIQDNLKKPEGITLIVGPTGCGKTTSLYAILNHLKAIDTKIVTIEDPVEIQLPLMAQVQVNEHRVISFGQAVRAFLRHDPDIILIGEIRDESTAQEALRAAMTGHQVFSTLHTNRAFDAILRLHDLGLPLTHMADYLSMIISQRLVRKLCPICKEKKDEGFIAHGCDSCRHGYSGQTVVAEILSIDETISDFLTQGNLVALKQHMKQSKHSTMSDDAKRLVTLGITSQEEIHRVFG